MAEYQKRFNERKWKAYMGFADTVRGVLEHMQAETLDEEMPSLTKRLFDFMGQLWIVGSDEVVDAVVRWRKVGQEHEAGSADPAVLVTLSDILIAMRRDLGNEETSLTARDLLSTFISDIDRALSEGSSSSLRTRD